MGTRARLKTTLEQAGVVHLDASVFALHATGHPRYVDLTRVVFGGLRAGEFEAQTSAVTLFQLLAEPYRRGREERALRAEACVTALPNLRILPVSPAIARQAAGVRAQLGGSVERALQLATALASEAEVFLTQRSTLRRVAGMRVDSLDAYVGPSSEPLS